MAQINMPNNPSDGDTHIAENGINYVYDLATDRWLVQADAASGANLWARDSGNTEIFPIYEGDSVLLKDSTDTETVTLDPANGVTLAAGLSFTGNFDIDSLTSLP